MLADPATIIRGIIRPTLRSGRRLPQQRGASAMSCSRCFGSFCKQLCRSPPHFGGYSIPLRLVRQHSG